MDLRHAIWAIKGAPPPAAIPPLWQRTRKLRSSTDSHMNHDLEDMDMQILGFTDPTIGQGPTRDEALADALGVRRTPRKPPMMMEPRSRNHRAEVGSANRSGFLHPSRSMRDGSRPAVGSVKWIQQERSGRSLALDIAISTTSPSMPMVNSSVKLNQRVYLSKNLLGHVHTQIGRRKPRSQKASY